MKLKIKEKKNFKNVWKILMDGVFELHKINDFFI